MNQYRPAIGQIRRIPMIGDGSRCILLLSFRDPGNQWFCAPLSRLKKPQTDYELSLKENGIVSNLVAQIWGMRDIDNSVIEQSEFIDTVSINNVDDVLRLWSSLIIDISISDDILARIGSPITDRNDERISYLKRELSVWDELCEFDP